MLRNLLLVAAIGSLLAIVSSAEAGVISSSADFTSTGVLVVDGSSSTTTLALSDPSSAILDVNVTVNVSKSGHLINTDGTLDTKGIEWSANDQLGLALTSPGGTTVDLVTPGTYSGQGGGGAQLETLVFDDSAALPVAWGQIWSSTFRPVGSLADFNAEDPTGDWTLLFKDTGAYDPLSVNSWSLTVTTDSGSPVPEPSTFALLGIGSVCMGFVGVRRRRKNKVA